MAERDNLVGKMQALAERAKDLTAEHARVVEEFLELQNRIVELDREQRKGLN